MDLKMGQQGDTLDRARKACRPVLSGWSAKILVITYGSVSD